MKKLGEACFKAVELVGWQLLYEWEGEECGAHEIVKQADLRVELSGLCAYAYVSV